MTTIREHVENGNFSYWVTNFYSTGKGQVPLCCSQYKKQKDGTWNLTCKWLEKKNGKKKYFTYEEFSVLCLKCQEEIERKIKERVTRFISTQNLKNYTGKLGGNTNE